MKRITVVSCAGFIVMVLTLTGTVSSVYTGEVATSANLNAQKYPILSKSEVAVLKGDLWTTASHDSKVAYVWGLCSMIEVERIAMQMLPELKVRNVSAVAAEGLQNVPMNDIVQSVDDYYKANPGNLDVPVLRAIWDTMVKPKVKTGVAGRPLQ